MTARTKLVGLLLVIAITAVLCGTALALASGSTPTRNVEPMTTACKLTPAEMQIAKRIQPSVKAGKLTPQAFIADVCG